MNTLRVHVPGPNYPDLFEAGATPIMEPVDVRGWLVVVRWRELVNHAHNGEERALEVVAQSAAEAKEVALWAARSDWAAGGFDFIAQTPDPLAAGTVSQDMIDAYRRWRRETAGELGQTRETAA